MKHNKPN